MRVRADFCRSRWCQHCGRRVAQKTRAAVEQLTAGKKTSLLTLTVPHVRGESLEVLIAGLLAAFQALRRGAHWRERVRGGAYVLEVKHNAAGGGWHPHLHVVLDADYIDHVWIKARWSEWTGCTGIRIEAVRSRDGIARYVAKYVSKQLDSSVFRDPDKLLEAIEAMSGSRAMGTFGDWRGVELQGEAEAFDPSVWKPLCRLEDVLDLCERGDTAALRVLRLITEGRGGSDPPGSRASPDESERPLADGGGHG